MVGQNTLHRLADLAGIQSDYWDVYGNHHETSDETRRTFLSVMGFETTTPEELQNSLARIQEDPWRRLLESVTTLRTGEGDAGLSVPVTVTAAELEGTISWTLDCEDGQTLNGHAPCHDLAVLESCTLDGQTYTRLNLGLPTEITLGYHQLRIEIETRDALATLIVAPKAAYLPDWMVKEKRRVWGVACQLYALRSENNWGIGDLSDLNYLCRETAKSGGGSVGLSPLHTLFVGEPDRISPYSPSSRLFLNPLYIDVTAVPDFSNEDSFSARLQAVQSTEQVAYADVTALKMEALARVFAAFVKAHPEGCGSARRLAFDAFVTEGGEVLHRYAVFEALQEHFSDLSSCQWDAPYQDPASPACAKFAHQNSDRVSFFAFLQWEAERQLEIAATSCRDGGMDIGLYRDLAVGVTPDGADAWVEDGAFMDGVNFGAPPDPLAPMGQDWGMPPFNPIRLREMAYAPYIDMLRANMRHAGAIRIDHVMWIEQLFCFPTGKDGRDGAYLRFPKDDLLAILALESHRNRCLVIGEDLGTVPEGFRERMADEGVLSYRLLHFQRYADGLYHRPDAYPNLCLATPASHDLPTLAGYWLGQDLDMLLDIGLIADADALADRKAERERERACLRAALVDQGLLPNDFPVVPDEAHVKAFVAAVHTFMARTPAALMMMNLEDLIGSTQQINVPGTIDQHPNWRVRLPVNLTEVCGPNGLAGAIAPVKAERR